MHFILNFSRGGKTRSWLVLGPNGTNMPLEFVKDPPEGQWQNGIADLDFDTLIWRPFLGSLHQG